MGVGVGDGGGGGMVEERGETGGAGRRGRFYWEVGDCNFRKAEEYGVYGYRIKRAYTVRIPTVGFK